MIQHRTRSFALECDFYRRPASRLRIGNNGADDLERNLASNPDEPARLQDPIEAILRIRKPAAYDQKLADREQGELEVFNGTRPDGEARAWRQFRVLGHELVRLGHVRVSGGFFH